MEDPCEEGVWQTFLLSLKEPVVNISAPQRQAHRYTRTFVAVTRLPGARQPIHLSACIGTLLRSVKNAYTTTTSTLVPLQLVPCHIFYYFSELRQKAVRVQLRRTFSSSLVSEWQNDVINGHARPSGVLNRNL